ncbi:uncharacterized protein BT62DRAFT_925821, partial [Guyanagaster necrorhizus]
MMGADLMSCILLTLALQADPCVSMNRNRLTKNSMISQAPSGDECCQNCWDGSPVVRLLFFRCRGFANAGYSSRSLLAVDRGHAFAPSESNLEDNLKKRSPRTV